MYHVRGMTIPNSWAQPELKCRPTVVAGAPIIVGAVGAQMPSYFGSLCGELVGTRKSSIPEAPNYSEVFNSRGTKFSGSVATQMRCIRLGILMWSS
jgi:hypothetical protein